MTDGNLNWRGVELGRILTGKPHGSVVYFVRFGADAVKIGTSTRLLPRINSLYLRLSDVFLLLPGGQELERAFHERFAADRIQERSRRELFSLSAVLSGLQAMGLYSPADDVELPVAAVQVREPLPSPGLITVKEAVAERVSGPSVDAVSKALQRDPRSPQPVSRRGNADEYDRVEWCDWEEARRQPRRLVR